MKLTVSETVALISTDRFQSSRFTWDRFLSGLKFEGTAILGLKTRLPEFSSLLDSGGGQRVTARLLQKFVEAF